MITYDNLTDIFILFKDGLIFGFYLSVLPGLLGFFVNFLFGLADN